jgi:outer membrane protein, heavy metal efflux system
MRATSFYGGGLGALLLAVAIPAGTSAQGGSGPATPAQAAPLTMDAAIRLALDRNQTLRAQRLAIDAARADEVTAALKPNPSLSFGADGLPVFSPSQLTGTTFANDVTYGATFSYTFERGGKRRNRATVARDTTDVTTKATADVERQVRFQTEQAFIGVLLAKSVLQLAQDNLKDFSDVVTLNQQRVASGDLSEGDFLKISLQKLQFQQDVSSAQVGLVQAKAALRQLVGFDTLPDDFDVAGDLAHAAHTVSLDDLKRAALASRPDLLAAQSGVRLAQDALALEHANRARDIEGDFDYSKTGPSNTVGAALAIELPFYDRNQGNIAHAGIAVQQATEVEAATRAGVLTDVVSAYAAYQTSDTVVGLYESGYLDQAQQSLDITTYAFQRGAASLLDLLDAERTYRDTQLGYRQALADYMTNVRQLNFVVGKQVIP